MPRLRGSARLQEVRHWSPIRSGFWGVWDSAVTPAGTYNTCNDVRKRKSRREQDVYVCFMRGWVR